LFDDNNLSNSPNKHLRFQALHKFKKCARFVHKTATNDQTNTKQITASNKQQTNNNKRCGFAESNVTERKGCVMRSTKSNGSIEIGQSLEKDIEASIHALTPTSAAFHRPENGNGEISDDDLSKLLRRVSEASTREIESLIDELHGLRKKLEGHGERIQSDIAKYAELAQGVMQLTAIISDNVQKLSPGEMAVSR
jgi:hypothetical protein